MADAAQVPSEREHGVGRERAPGHDAEGNGEDRPEDSAVGSAAPTAAEPLELTQQERAEATLRSIMSGGNLTAETMKLSNDFTDRHVSRLKSLFRRAK